MKPTLLPELYEKLKELDEITLIELLKLDSEKIVDLCMDVIDENADELEQYFEEEEEE
jgi:hypothetical protein